MDTKKNERLAIPTVGDIIYIDTSLSVGHGIDDIQGGKAMIVEVSLRDTYVYVEVDQDPGAKYGWAHLASEQESLKSKFGDSWAHPKPDYRPEFNTGF